MAGAVIPVGVPLSPRNIYLHDPVFSISQTASRGREDNESARDMGSGGSVRHNRRRATAFRMRRVWRYP